MEDILDALRRIVGRWVETVTPISQSVSIDDTTINVNSSLRFQVGDQVMIEGPLEGEPNLIIDEIVDDTHISLSTPVANNWSLSESPVLRKLVNGMFIEGIYLGDPEVIPRFPAITINGTSIDSEWMTIGSTKERYEVELSIFVEQAAQEDGYRFLLNMIKVMREGLKRNFYPLVNDYETTSVIANIAVVDEFIKVEDSSIFNTPVTDTSAAYPRVSDARAIIEDRWKSQETRVQEIIDATTIRIAPGACTTYNVSDNAIVIAPHRFIFNTWPHSTQIGKTSKGALLQTAVINWFAEEQELRDYTNAEPHLR